MLENWSSKQKLIDVDKKVKEFLISELDKVPSDRIVDWDMFRKHCIELGMNRPPNLLTIPVSVLDRILKEIKCNTT